MNIISIIGNLTADPELRHTPSGTAVADLRVAVNSREKKGEEWVDRADFFDVTVWSKQAENCNQYLSKGKKVGITGRLRQERWQNENGDNRSRVKIVASHVEFLTPRGESESDGGRYESDVPADTRGMDPAPAGGGGGYRSDAASGDDSDIPF